MKTGREEVLMHLHTTLNSGNAALVSAQAISGLGGIDKTQVATEYAYRYSDEYQVILWVRAETYDVFFSDCVAIAEVLSSTARADDHLTFAVEVVKNWLNNHTNWLLIADNVEEISYLRELMPFKSRGHIVLTTRS